MYLQYTYPTKRILNILDITIIIMYFTSSFYAGIFIFMPLYNNIGRNFWKKVVPFLISIFPNIGVAV